jgi:HD-GYP domain-containing protein (c-di-GMP phosphodiesterase class II)
MPVKHIPSSQIEIGMYISCLDRPWLETPFLFQGFEVHTQKDIDELQRLTKFVYVMEPDEIINIKRPSTDHSSYSRITQELHKKTYKNTVTAEDEIKDAHADYEEFSQLVSEVKTQIQSEDTLQLGVFQRPIENMVNSVVKNPDAFLWLTRLRKFDSFLYKDSLSASVLATAMGRRLGLPEDRLQTLATGCLLMDIGKLSLPLELLHKIGRLTQNEWALMKTHVQRGIDLLESSPHCNTDILDIVRTHHERLDGCGYIAGLHGDQIPLFGQIAGIVDQYVAVTSPRPFAKTISPSQAEQMLYSQGGRIFDEMLVDYFIQTISTYPTGSLVLLSSGEVGIVKAQNSRLQLKPSVILLLDPDKKAYGNYAVVNMDDYHKNNNPVSIIRTLADGEYGLIIEDLSI